MHIEKDPARYKVHATHEEMQLLRSALYLYMWKQETVLQREKVRDIGNIVYDALNE